MLPEIVLLGRTLPMYGVMAAAAAVAALLYVRFRAPVLGLDAENAVYIAAFGGVGALLGAKLLYLALVFPNLLRDMPLLFSAPEIFTARYVTGGLVFYGGLFGALLGALWAAGQYKVKLTAYCPVLIPALALAHGIARIGCFCAGCCYGVESERFGIAFHISHVAPNGVPLVPVQLIESAAELFIFAFLVWFTQKPPRRRFTLPAYLLLYAPVRFLLEFWRGDAARGIWFGLSTSQWLSLFTAAAVVSYLLYRRKKSD